MNEFSLTTSNPNGYDSESVIGDFALAIDPMDETGPNPNAVLVADYASCFLPAVRMGAQQNGYDDLGEMEIEATAAIDDHDDLQAIEFTLKVEAAVDDPDELVALGEELCHVHAALRDGLAADVTVEDEAF